MRTRCPESVAVLVLDVQAEGLHAQLSLLAQAAECSPQVCQRLLHLGNLGSELIRFDAEALPTAGAAQCRIRLDLSDGLRELALAVRAGQVDGLPVEVADHGGPRAR